MGKDFKGNERLGEERLSNQGCPMRIVEYNNSLDIIIEFQDRYKARIYTTYNNFLKGNIKNPYYKSVFRVGMVGNRYPTWTNGKRTKEYTAWSKMLERCFDRKLKNRQSTYENTICCEGWLLFDNFYEWLHSQENFERWINTEDWAIDKDILVKGNKVYSPDTCCLVPKNVNSLFVKCDAVRGDLPVGVSRCGNLFYAKCRNPFKNKSEYLGSYHTPEEAFKAYKQYKENIVKQIAEIEYNKGNLTKECYKAMLNYEVEITD